nr:PadR family transcriptional regulator [Candidatus Bathyarchaeota archaeon]
MPTGNDDEIWVEKAKESITKFMVLLTLSQKPTHGYELMKRIRNCTDGWLKSTSGSIYPVLKKLEEEGLVKGVWVRGEDTPRMKKRYYITDKGLSALEKMIATRRKVARLFKSIFNRTMYDQENVDYSAITSQITLDLDEIDRLITFLKQKKEKIELLLQRLTQIREQMKVKGK